MSKNAVICYPIAFLNRNIDRSLLMELELAGVPKAEAKLMLYRIWADFGTSGADRRPVNPEDLSQDRQVRVIEQFCEWTGKPGELVNMAIVCGFLKLEGSGDSTMLVCVDFYPINAGWSSGGRSFQTKGAYARALKVQQEESAKAVRQQEELFARTQSSHFTGLSAEERQAGRMLITSICRALGVKIPSDEVLDGGPMLQAVEVTRAHPEEQIREVLLWMISERKSGTIPKDRIDAVLREFPEYLKKVRLVIE